LVGQGWSTHRGEIRLLVRGSDQVVSGCNDKGVVTTRMGGRGVGGEGTESRGETRAHAKDYERALVWILKVGLGEFSPRTHPARARSVRAPGGIAPGLEQGELRAEFTLLGAFALSPSVPCTQQAKSWQAKRIASRPKWFTTVLVLPY
jgi:hypothetical protein